MKIAVIIAEFNPLHKGHEYLIQQTRAITDCTHIVVIQTGNFTQRAEPAIIEKHLRAQSAIMCGVDAVLEMPTAYATNNAEIFAKAGVQLANIIPHASYLVYGVEDNNLQNLKQIAYVKLIKNHEFDKYIKVHLKAGLSYSAAQAEVIKKLLPEIHPAIITKILSGGNNILAIEYLRELYRLHSSIQPVSIKRFTDEKKQTNTTALAIRDAYYNHTKPIEHYIPAQVLPFTMQAIEKHPVKEMFESTILYGALTELDTKHTYNATPEIAKLFRGHRPVTYDQLSTDMPNPHYSANRLKRVALHATLGVTQKDIQFIYQHNHLPYVNLLAIRSDAHDLFNELSSIRLTPVILHGNYNRPTIDKYYIRMRQIDNCANSLYEISCKQRFSQKPLYVILDKKTEPIITDTPSNDEFSDIANDITNENPETNN
ncbi:MAG: nucleotidyltransferase family protein [Clostridia bacterium]|nr:nucleotidyltransferase family protein [Clostridia bacterium]